MTIRTLICIGSLSMFLAACQKHRESDSTDASKNHLRSALIALDAGDDATAERELNEALSTDPLNDRARTTLASVYAKQAGIGLREWLDPFWSAGQQISSSSKSYSRTLGIIDESLETAKAFSNSIDSKLSEEERKIRDRVLTFTSVLSKFTLGASISIDIFQAIPFLSANQLSRLDKAIHVLRANETSYRSEEIRVYLAVLSFVRMVNHMKRLLGDENTYSMIPNRDKLCKLNADTLKEHLTEVRTSLQYVEEGLVVLPNDPATKQRQIRQNMQRYVTSFLTSPVWEQIDTLFDQNTIEGHSAFIFSKRFCDLSKDFSLEIVMKEATDEFKKWYNTYTKSHQKGEESIRASEHSESRNELLIEALPGSEPDAVTNQ